MVLYYLLEISDYTNCKMDKVNGTYSLIDLFKILSKRYGNIFAEKMMNKDMTKISDEVTVLVNGVNVKFLDGDNTLIRDDDVVTIIPLLMGG